MADEKQGLAELLDNVGPLTWRFTDLEGNRFEQHFTREQAEALKRAYERGRAQWPELKDIEVLQKIIELYGAGG